MLRDFYEDTTEDAYLMQFRCMRRGRSSVAVAVPAGGLSKTLAAAATAECQSNGTIVARTVGSSTTAIECGLAR